MSATPRCAVGIARCIGYESQRVEEAVSLAVERAGGMASGDWQDVLLKTNLLAPRCPEDAVTTHPEVLRGVACALRRQNRDVSLHIADNPGYVHVSGFQRLFDITGVAAMAAEEEITVGPLSDKGYAEAEGAFKVLHSPRVALRYRDASFCVNVAKMKTHVETEITGCIKNIFGIADTQTRKKAHQSPSKWHLADAVVDLFEVRRPEFHVLDAIVAMEGNGPSHGTPRSVGWVLAGNNALAIDIAAAIIMGYRNPMDIPLLKAAADRLGGPFSMSEIDLVGAQWDELPIAGFKKSSGGLRLLPTFLRGLAHGLVSLKPELDASKCIRCNICRDVCPVNAISMHPLPEINLKACVACLCCHEMCPTGAMGVRENWLARMLSK